MALAEADRTNIPATHAFTITPANSTDLAHATRGIWVGGAGNLNVTMVGGETVVITGVAAGTLLPLAVTQVQSSSTTATSLVGLY